MRTILIALAASTAAATTPAPEPKPAEPTTAAAKPGPAKGPTLPFAATLAQQAPISGPGGWHGVTGQAAWSRLAKARPEQRQEARWQFALGLIADRRGAEALGVLDTMRVGDPDLMMVPQFQLARGVALAMNEHPGDAIAALETAELSGNPEACAWRMLAHAAGGEHVEAVRTINCALPAINARSREARAPFVLAAAESAIKVGQPKPALGWLKLFSDRDSHANFLRGKALIAMGKIPEGTLRLERALPDADTGDRIAIKLALLESQLATRRVSPADAIKQLDTLRYGWRGGDTERRALELQFKLASEANDLRGSLRAGATLFRWFKLGSESGAMLATLRAMLAAALSPEGGVPLPEAAGLYWDYRELAPAGTEGDVLVLRLVDRLATAGLYERAAELLQYQLMQRMQDVAQGPMSVKVAELHIRAGHPERALTALQETEQPSYSDGMRQDRKRMEAVALHRLGKDEAAMAALQDVADGDAIRAEMQWRSKSWEAFAATNNARLPAPRVLGGPQQAAVLRQAVALAMLGREDGLKALRARYGAAFAKFPNAEAFDVLTRDAASVDPNKIAAAMAAIPDASPAGELGDLLDAGQ